MYDGEPTTSPFTRAGCAGSPSLDSAMPKSMSTSRPSGPSSKVGRLYVTVDDAGVVHGAERGEELQADRGTTRGGSERPLRSRSAMVPPS